MISTKVLHRSDAAKSSNYYSDQKDDYYSRDGNAAVWQGKGAALLGLEGEVSPEKFKAMLSGHFGSGVKPQSTIRLDSKARAGLDLTFSAPKSITLQALIGADKSVIEAHDKAVSAALNYIEKELTQGRYKKQGKSYIENTGNLIVAKFRHETARPTKEAPPDPQLHTHAIIMNLTRREDGTWVALSNEQIYKMKKLVDAIYKSELASELQKAGHDLRHEKNNIELANISREQIEVFSKRSQDIIEDLQRRGLSRMTATHEQKQISTLSTRKGKTAELSRDELFKQWADQAKAAGIEFTQGHSIYGPKQVVDGKTSPGHNKESRNAEGVSKSDQSTERVNYVARSALQWAIRHLGEREAILNKSDLLVESLRHAGGYANLDDIEREMAIQLKRGSLLKGEQMYQETQDTMLRPLTLEGWIIKTMRDYGISREDAQKTVEAALISGGLKASESHYTTRKAFEIERAILDMEFRGRGVAEPVMTPEAVHTKLGNQGLKPGQLDAAKLILTTNNSIVGVQGLAGTGKSHMLDHVKDTLIGQGYNMVALASYGTQVRALRELGVESRTIASFLEAINKERFANQIDQKTVVVVDEAGVVPARLMRRLLARMEKAGARVVLLGDTAQTKAIEAGRPFEQLQTEGMQTAWMRDIQRQKNPELKRAVELAAAGKAGQSLAYVESLYGIEDEDERYSSIAKKYANMTKDERGETLILTGTNKSRNEINTATHEEMGLAGKGFYYTLLTRRDTTQAERRHAKYYVSGDIIQPERDYACGLKRGERYRVLGQTQGERNKLGVENVNTGERIDFAPGQARKVSVYEPVRAELSAGDWVRVTRNDAELDVANGERYEVLAVSPTHVTIDVKGRKVQLDGSVALHLDRAYATTAHSAQGLTCDRVLINIETYSRTTKQDVYYVGISRARYGAEIYTNDPGSLPEAINRREDKSAALDIVREALKPQKQQEKEEPELG